MIDVDTFNRHFDEDMVPLLENMVDQRIAEEPDPEARAVMLRHREAIACSFIAAARRTSLEEHVRRSRPGVLH